MLPESSGAKFRARPDQPQLDVYKRQAVEQGVKMPSFFGYMAWSVGILVPVFLLITFLFFM